MLRELSHGQRQTLFAFRWVWSTKRWMRALLVATVVTYVPQKGPLQCLAYLSSRVMCLLIDRATFRATPRLFSQAQLHRAYPARCHQHFQVFCPLQSHRVYHQRIPHLCQVLILATRPRRCRVQLHRMNRPEAQVKVQAISRQKFHRWPHLTFRARARRMGPLMIQVQNLALSRQKFHLWIQVRSRVLILRCRHGRLKLLLGLRLNLLLVLCQAVNLRRCHRMNPQ